MSNENGPHDQPPQVAALQPGDLVAGRYRIDEMIGRGGMGSVYRATQLGLFRAVALKVVHPEFAASERYRARFEREARVMASLDHQNVAAVYDFGVDNGTLFLVMELLLGRSLSRQLNDAGPLTVPDAVRIGLVVTDVLRAAHAMRLVHRDLKPENLFVLDDGTIKVVDFGLAFIDEAGDLGRMTKANTVTGTPTHMAPEQAAGRALGPPVDMYALGVMLFEFVTGTTPFSGSAGEVLAKHIYTPPPTLSSILGAPVDQGYQDLVALLLKKFPDARPSAQEAHAMLEAIVRDDGAREPASREVRALGLPPRHTAPMGSLAPATAQTFTVFSETDLSQDEITALSSVGLVCVSGHAGANVVIPRYPTAEVVKRWVAQQHRVVARVDPLNLALVTELLRAGVTDVVSTSATPSDLAKKVMRAARRGLLVTDTPERA